MTNREFYLILMGINALGIFGSAITLAINLPLGLILLGVNVFLLLSNYDRFAMSDK